MMEETSIIPSSKLLTVSFRGKKVEAPLKEGMKVGQVKALLTVECSDEVFLQPSDVKLLCKGKVLKDDEEDTYQLLVKSGKKKSVYHLIATGVSSTEAQAIENEFQQGVRHAPRIRDDLTEAGRVEMERRRRLGQRVLQKSAKTLRDNNEYGFGRIETLSNLPNREKAREILETLANDPGVKACMAKHQWKVPSLAELYPEGKVGESEVCVMGLNKNKGQQILLRIRTDDLQGFRKMLSIRKVLYHELAHNVHSEHDGDFFFLMRQIERECNELDWTGGAGLSSSSTSETTMPTLYTGGTYRLGGEDISGVSQRELTAQAALSRMTAEEEEIQRHCGCRSQFKKAKSKDDSKNSTGIE